MVSDQRSLLTFATMSFLRVSEIHKRDERGFHLNNISFALEASQKLAIAGATGSGKTTLLKIVGGLAQADSGTVWLNGERVKGANEQLIPGHKNIGYLSQHFELRNHYRVEEILDYANQLTDKAAAELYELCRVDFLLKRWSTELSGGERQRVALARILTASPTLLLLDEPFSNLDLPHKTILKEVVRDIGNHLDITSILVSHDAADILPWADDIIILRDGVMIERGTPQDIYLSPVETYTASLFGKYNLMDAYLLSLFGYPQPVDGTPLLLRPEHFEITNSEANTVEATIHTKQYLGYTYEYTLMVHGLPLVVHSNTPGYSVGDTVRVRIDNEGLLPTLGR